MDEWKRSGQIPAFGNWDFTNELPITQYFECARQAGLVRYSSSSGQSDPYVCSHRDLHPKPLRDVPPSALKKTRKRRDREKRCALIKENANMNMKKKGNVGNLTEAARRAIVEDDSAPPRRPKPIDEDLYEIPPELLHTSKPKKMLSFISKCLVAAVVCV